MSRARITDRPVWAQGVKGRMIHIRVTPNLREDLYAICRETRRTQLHVLSLAVAHRRAMPWLYRDAMPPTLKECGPHRRLGVRMPYKVVESLTQYAWEDDQYREPWIGATFKRFLEIVDRKRMMETLSECVDIRAHLLEQST